MRTARDNLIITDLHYPDMPDNLPYMSWFSTKETPVPHVWWKFSPQIFVRFAEVLGRNTEHGDPARADLRRRRSSEERIAVHCRLNERSRLEHDIADGPSREATFVSDVEAPRARAAGWRRPLPATTGAEATRGTAQRPRWSDSRWFTVLVALRLHRRFALGQRRGVGAWRHTHGPDGGRSRHARGDLVSRPDALGCHTRPQPAGEQLPERAVRHQPDGQHDHAAGRRTLGTPITILFGPIATFNIMLNLALGQLGAHL